MHPAHELRGSTSSKLQNKRIVLGITGSIAAVETIKIARALIRHGADVIPLMTPAATKIIHPDALEFATGHHPIIELTGQTEHVKYCGLVNDPVDLLLICPCTANTLSKIAHGIDDSPVTTFATTALGSQIPICIVPAMHLSMYNHKIIQQNITICTQQHISIIQPDVSQTKAKLPTRNDIVAQVIRIIPPTPLHDKKVLIIGGATAEPVDDIRLLTNRSSGKTAVSLTTAAYEMGAQVTQWYGYAQESPPPLGTLHRFQTIADLQNLLKKNKSTFDIIVLCAAIADYIPKKHTGKIPSGKTSFNISCIPAPKIITKLRTQFPKATLVGYKVEDTKQKLKSSCTTLLEKNRLDLVIGNTISAFGSEINTIVLVTKNKTTQITGSKEDLAYQILQRFST